MAPLLIDMATAAPPDAALSRRLASAKEEGGADFLFVGKVSPHKAQHDLVKMLAVYRRLYDGRARLHLVGTALGKTYEPALSAFIAELGLTDAVSITGSVSQEELESYFQMADVFVCASEHEGFCVPLVEAMGHGLPIVAYANSAIPETVRDAGLLLSSKEPLVFAASVHRVLSDERLRKQFVASGARRAEDFSLARRADASSTWWCTPSGREPASAAERNVARATGRRGAGRGGTVVPGVVGPGPAVPDGPS